MGGIAQRLSAWRGEPVVLNFWATWCEPCRAELPLFAALANDEGPRLHVLSIAIGPPGSLHAYLAANALALPAIDDPAGALARTYGVSAIPVTVLIDGSGRIVDREIGELDRAGLVAALARVLPPPAPAAAPTALPAKAPADAI